MTRRGLAFGALLGALVIYTSITPDTAHAYYESNNDTVKALDFIENARRGARENRMLPDQIELVEDAMKMSQMMRRPVDPEKNMPVAIEGDDMFYDQATGDVYAKGDVRITEVDARRFESDEARGNIKKQEVEVEGKGHFVQMTPGTTPFSLDGYKLVYNYGHQRGRMGTAEGKIGRYYVYGRRLEFYPGKIVVYDGYATKCSAKEKDYRISGDFIEIFPNDELIVYKARFWLKNKIIHTRDEYRVDISPDADHEQHFPHVGYSNTHGVWISDHFTYDFTKNFWAFADVKYYTRRNFKNVYGLKWKNHNLTDTNTISVEYGSYKDSNDRWIKKEPTMKYEYKNKLGYWPFHYTVSFERGYWIKKRTESWHTNYGVYLGRDTFTMTPTWHMNYGAGYYITKESYDHSRRRSFVYDAKLFKNFGDRLIAYVGYHFSQYTLQRALFDYNADDYKQKLLYGLSYELTDHDRIVFGQEMDVKKGSLRDTDYYWFHDLHCAQMITRYRAKRKEIHVSLQFTPW